MSARPLLFPAIDLLGGRAVRLHKGERATAKVYSDDPPAQARAFVAQGAQVLHVVDLDAAFGEPRQLALIERIARAIAPVPVQVGGGVRDLASAEATLAAGAARVIFGTAIVERPELGGEAVARFGVERVAAGIDVKDGRAAVRGWTAATGPTAAALAATLLQQGVRWFVVTAVARDGTLGGFDVPLLREVAAAAPGARLVASGGAGALEHLRALSAVPGLAGAIAGTALYEGRFTITEGQAALDGLGGGSPGDADARTAAPPAPAVEFPHAEWRRGPLTVSCDPDRLDRGLVHRTIAASYWAKDIPRETMDRALEGSLCFGLYAGEEQVGLARVVTDRATFAYLCDVFVLEAQRGRGLGQWLIECVVAHPDLQGLRRFSLATRDAHGLYARFGFTAPARPDRLMEKLDSDVYARTRPGAAGGDSLRNSRPDSLAPGESREGAATQGVSVPHPRGILSDGSDTPAPAPAVRTFRADPDDAAPELFPRKEPGTC